MVEHEGERGRVEAGVERIEHRAAHWRAVVAFEHRGRVGEHDRDRVAAHDPALRQRGREPFRARVKVAIVAPEGPVRDREPVRKHRRRAFEEGQRCERLEVGVVAVEIAIVGRLGHEFLFIQTAPAGDALDVLRIGARADRRHHTVRSALGEGIRAAYGRKAKKRKPRKVRSIAPPPPTATKTGRIAGVAATPKRGAMRTQAE